MEINVGNRLKEIRQSHGLSQRALAKNAGVTNGIVSMIELNRTSPSLATLKKILDSFPVSLSDFFGNNFGSKNKIVFSANELVEIGSSDYSLKQVDRNLTGKAMQILHERIKPGGDSGKEMLHHESEEGGVVIRGQVELTVGNEVHVLNAGDAYYFDSRSPHRFRNIGDDEVEIVSSCSPPGL